MLKRSDLPKGVITVRLTPVEYRRVQDAVELAAVYDKQPTDPKRSSFDPNSMNSWCRRKLLAEAQAEFDREAKREKTPPATEWK